MGDLLKGKPGGYFMMWEAFLFCCHVASPPVPIVIATQYKVPLTDHYPSVQISILMRVAHSQGMRAH